MSRAAGLRVGLTFDLRDSGLRQPDAPADALAELDDVETIDDLAAALAALGHRVVRIGGLAELVALDPGERAALDVVFNLAEGLRGRGREAQVPALLEAWGIAYSGADPVSMALTLDKALTKRVWLGCGLPTAAFCVVEVGAEIGAEGCGPPAAAAWFVKPVAEGSSMGVDEGSLVLDAESLRRRVEHVWRAYRQAALVEAYLPGREFTVGLLRGGEVLGVIENVSAGVAYSHEAKATLATSDLSQRFRVPPEGELVASLARLAQRAFRAVDCRDVARVDLRCDAAGRPHLLEINALPALAPRASSLRWMAEQAQWSYPALIGTILEGALARRSRHRQHPGGPS